MGEIKFNLVRLLDCKTRIDYVAKELRQNVDEAMALIDGLGSEKQYWLAQSIKGIMASIDGINVMSGKLARLGDLYGECERTVENIVRRLFVPVPIIPQQSASSAAFMSEYSVSQTMPRDLFVESWIMEMIYSEGV